MEEYFKQYDKDVDQLYNTRDNDKFLKRAKKIKNNYLDILNADELVDIELKHKPADVKNNIYWRLSDNDNRDFFSNIKLDLPKKDYLNTTEVDDTLYRNNPGVLGQYVVEPDIRFKIYKLIYNENLVQNFLKVITFLITTKYKFTELSELDYLIRRFTNLNLVLLIRVLNKYDCVVQRKDLMTKSLKEYIVHKCDPAFFYEIIEFLLKFGSLPDDLTVFIYKNAIPDDYIKNAQLDSLKLIKKFSDEFQAIWRSEINERNFGAFEQRSIFDHLSKKLNKQLILRGFTWQIFYYEPSPEERKLLQENCYFVNPGSFTIENKLPKMPLDMIFALLCFSERDTRHFLFKKYFNQLSIYYAFISVFSNDDWEIEKFIEQQIPKTNLAYALAFAKNFTFKAGWSNNNLLRPSSFLKKFSIPNIVTARLYFPYDILNADNKSKVPKELAKFKASELANFFQIPQQKKLNLWFIQLVNNEKINPIDDIYEYFTPMLWHYYILCLHKYNNYDFNANDVYDLLKNWSKVTTEEGLYPETIVTLIGLCDSFSRLDIRIDELKIQKMSPEKSEELEWIVLWKRFNPSPENFELFKVNTSTKLLFMLVMIYNKYFRKFLSDKVYFWLLDHKELITKNIQLYIAHKYAYLSYFKTDWKNDDERLRFLNLFGNPDEKINVFVDIIKEKIEREIEVYEDQRAKLLVVLENENFKKAQKITNFLKNRHLSRLNNDKELIKVLSQYGLN